MKPKNKRNRRRNIEIIVVESKKQTFRKYFGNPCSSFKKKRQERSACQLITGSKYDSLLFRESVIKKLDNYHNSSRFVDPPPRMPWKHFREFGRHHTTFS